MRRVVKDLSRRVLVYKQPIRQECPNCYYDKLTGRSTGKCRWTLEEAEQKQAEHELVYPGQIRYKWFRVGRCPICLGKGVLEVKRKKWVDCLVVWNPSDRYSNEITFTPAGTEGSTLVQLKTDIKYFDLFKNCEYVEVDGVECKISNPPIVRGLGNHTLLIVTGFTTDKPKDNSGEKLKEYS